MFEKSLNLIFIRGLIDNSANCLNIKRAGTTIITSGVLADVLNNENSMNTG